MTHTVTITQEELQACKEEYPTGNNKVGAIKKMREFTGAGLKPCKEFVESGYDFTGVYEEHGTGASRFVVFELKHESVAQMMGRLFELTAEIAEIHRRLEGMEDDD
jgi:hypothetical protein